MISATKISKTFKIKQHCGKDVIGNLINPQYTEKVAVENFNVIANDCEIIGIIGLNGAGKTTIIKMLSGIMKPDKGTISINGYNPFLKSKKYRNDVALILGQNTKLDSDASLIDSVRLYSAYYNIDESEGLKNTRKMAENLLLNELDINKQCRMLSLGQRMKCEIILSFLHTPHTIFLDEPTLGLDYQSCKIIRNFLKQYVKQNNACIILTSHNIQDIEALCERIYVIDKGKTIFNGNLNELSNYTKLGKLVSFSCENIDECININGLNISNKDSNKSYFIKYSEENSLHVFKFIENNFDKIECVNFSNATLEDMIDNLYKRGIKE